MFILTDKKRCNKCGEYKTLPEFQKRKDKYSSPCKACVNKQMALWRSENAESVLDRERLWRASHPERLRQSRRKWRLSNKEKVSELDQKWRDNNREKFRARIRTRRALVSGSNGHITASEWKELCDMYGNKCLCCQRSDVKLTLDHVIPLAGGGSHTIDNVQPLCQSCNSSKGTKVVDYR